MSPSKKELRRLSFINRQPTLWRHGIGAVTLVPSDDDDDETIGLSPLGLAAYNADFDGDTEALYVMHDNKSLEEMYEKAYIQNTIKCDSDDSMLSTIRHEALYGAYILTENITPNQQYVNNPYNITSLVELEESIEMYNNWLDYPIAFNNQIYAYGVVLMNKWCGFDDVKINTTIAKNKSQLISKTIYEDSESNKSYYDRLTVFNKKLLYFISTTKHCPSLNVNEMLNILSDDESQLFDKLPSGNVELGYHINEALVDRCLNKFDNNASLYKLFKSGSRFSRKQLSRSCINIGYTADEENIVVSKPISTNLMSGLTPEDFFLGAPGSRKGIADKSDFTPQSGYMERTLTMALSPLEIVEDDCQGLGYLEITIFSKKHAKTLVHKYYKDAINPQDEWQVLDYNTAVSYINKNILIRSPMTCSTPGFKMCKKCFGEKDLPTSYVGITAAQCLAERLTQLIMRSFHTSGSADLNVHEPVRKLLMEHLIDIKNENTETTLIFDIDDFPEEIEQIAGFKHVNKNTAIFGSIDKPVENIDAVSVMLNVKNLLKTQKNINKTPSDFYSEMMSAILQVGEPYSSFIEMLFANMFVVDEDATQFWRYHQDDPIVKKLGDKTLASKLSKLLGLLYEPNKKSLASMGDLANLEMNPASLNIYERIWLGLF